MARRLPVAAVLLTALLLLPAVALGANDPYRSQQWSLDDLRIDEAWEVDRGRDAIVAVIDTGVDLDHPDLRDRILRDTEGEVLGLDLVADDPIDQHGHGTLVAGIVAATADNGEGIGGVAPRARIMPIRVLDEDGAGRASDVETAIRWAVDHGADVINLSLESLRDDDGRSQGPGVSDSAIDYAWEHDVVVVIASGNSGAGASDYPDDTPALVVGASDRDGEPATFSDHGGAGGVLAPGVGIISTWCRARDGGGCDGGTHTYGIAEGTSFAAPHVAGVAALLSSAGHDAEEIVTRIRATAVGGTDQRPGRVDAAAALTADREALEAQQASAEDEDGRTTVPASPQSTSSEGGDESPSNPQEPTPAPEPAPEPTPEPDPEPAPEPESETEPAPEPDPEPEPESEPPPEPATEPVAMADGDGTDHEMWIKLVAAALVGASLVAWSSEARRSV